MKKMFYIIIGYFYLKLILLLNLNKIKSTVQIDEESLKNINTKSIDTTSNSTKATKTEEKFGRYVEAINDRHREARELFGKK
jgi:hypothetical protein